MGFNLKMMFDELANILSSAASDAEKLAALTDAIVAAQKYADECGQLR